MLINVRLWPSLFACTVLLCALCGCIGHSDFEEKIGSTGLVYQRFSSVFKVITWNSDEMGQKVIVDPVVIKYKLDKDVVYGVRQIANSVSCGNVGPAWKMTGELEYFLINVRDGEKPIVKSFKAFKTWERELIGLSIRDSRISAMREQELAHLMLPISSTGSC